MKTWQDEELTDFELTEILACWTVPDPPSDLRRRVFSGKPLPFAVVWEPLDIRRDPSHYAGLQFRSIGAALLLQTAAVALVFLFFGSPLARQAALRGHQIVYLPSYKARMPVSQKAGGGGGGGQLARTPVAKGAAPQFARRQFVPPTPAVAAPRLPVAPSITAAAPQITAEVYGDPLSKLRDSSPGQGTNGLGSGTGSGLGNGRGEGYGPGEGGGEGGGAFRIGGDVSGPILVSKVEPQYSEQARKAKFSGTVVLSVIISPQGLPRSIRVVRPLGLGLDEKAIEAVGHWRFRPGTKNGKPVAVFATVEVNFRLL